MLKKVGMHKLMRGRKVEYVKYGCFIMSDEWTDQMRRILINFLINCSLETMLVESVDALLCQNREKIFELFGKFVECLENVVQVIMYHK